MEKPSLERRKLLEFKELGEEKFRATMERERKRKGREGEEQLSSLKARLGKVKICRKPKSPSNKTLLSTTQSAPRGHDTYDAAALH